MRFFLFKDKISKSKETRHCEESKYLLIHWWYFVCFFWFCIFWPNVCNQGCSGEPPRQGGVPGCPEGVPGVFQRCSGPVPGFTDTHDILGWKLLHFALPLHFVIYYILLIRIRCAKFCKRIGCLCAIIFSRLVFMRLSFNCFQCTLCIECFMNS